MRLSAERRIEIDREALTRATTSPALTNYPTIFREFMGRGISESDIDPRINVFTFHAWRALGRTVRRGEHGVAILTYVPIVTSVNKETGEPETVRRPRTAYVFHISQTEPLTPRTN